MNLVECSRCHSVLIAEEFRSHKCEIRPKKHIKVLAGQIIDLTTDGHKTLLIDSLDGISYMIEVKEKGEPLSWPSDDILQRKKSDRDFTEPKLRNI